MKALIVLVPLFAACSTETAKMMSTTDGGVDGGADAGACPPSALRPSGRKDVDGVLVPDAKKLLLYGGDEAPFDPTAATQPRQLVDETWRLDLACGTWERLPAVGAGARAGYAAAFDAKRNRMIIVGGQLGTTADPPLVNDVWALDLTALTWSELHPTGTPPSPRVSHRAVFDDARDRMLVFGGTRSRLSGPALGELMELSFAASADGAWTQLTASDAPGAPSKRYDVAMATDGKVALVFGGAASFSTYYNDVWLFDLAANAWRKAPVATTAPSQRFAMRAAFDPTRSKFWLFGGHDLGSLGLRNDTWTVALDATATTATFAQVLAGDIDLGVGNVDKSSPERRHRHGQVVSGDRMWVVAGASDCGELDDTWTLDLTQPTRYTPVLSAQVGETCARRAAPGQACPTDCGNPL
jgi:hypothetical protein